MKNIIEIYGVDNAIKLPIKAEDVAALEEALKAVEGKPCFNRWRDTLTGPATGLAYDEDTDTLSIVDGWGADENGNIVKLV